MKVQRIKRLEAEIQKEISIILQSSLRESNVKNTIVSVTRVRLTEDLSTAKIFVSIFPFEKSTTLFIEITDRTVIYRTKLACELKNFLRKIPVLEFELDDSLECMREIDNLLKKAESKQMNFLD